MRFFNSILERGILYKIIVGIVCISLALILGYSGWCLVLRKYVYPLKYQELVFENADKYNLDESLVYSVIKTESSFDQSAVSKKGAKGLMQITDSTASYIAKRLGVGSFDIFEPKVNIEFGCYYLRYLIDRFREIDTAVIAYNAGESKVSEWLNNSEYSTDGIRVQNIPYKETREYLNKVKKSLAVYKKMYKNIVDK